MNVLQIMDYAAPYKGNFIPSIQNLEKHLNEDGGQLIYMFPTAAQNIEWIKELKNEGRKIYFIDNSFFSKKIKFSLINKLLDIIKHENISIIHTHFVAYNYTLVLMKIWFIPKVRIIGNFMNEFIPPKNIYSKLKVFVTKATFDLIVASSAAVKQSVLNAGINSKKIVVIYNALDIMHLHTSDLINLKDTDSQKIILMFGWTFHRKGVDIAIGAINKLIEEKINVKLVIAMSGGEQIIKSEVIALLGIMPSWITLLGPRSDVAAYYNSSDIFLSSSREEGFTYSVLEASYCNPMIVVSEIGGHPLDIPFIGRFESENIVQLKDRINEMLTKSPEEKRLINATQKDYVVRMYNIENWSKHIMENYSII